MHHILVVEDDPTVRSLVAGYLQRAGFSVTVAPNGREALTALQQASFDLVVTDMNMPQLDGVGLIAAMREAGLAMPVIPMSGTDDIANPNSLLARAVKLGSAAPLMKPFSFAQLAAAVRAQLGPAAPPAGRHRAATPGACAAASPE